MLDETTTNPPSPQTATPPLGKEESREEGTETRIYEVGYLMVPTVPEGELAREVTVIKDILEREKAVIISEEFPKLRPLAYTMQKRVEERYEKHTNGYFGWVKFEASPKGALGIEQAFKQNKPILRYLLVKTVREHTLTAGRLRVDRRERKKDIPQDAPVKTPVSEVELDKSIEKLIAD